MGNAYLHAARWFAAAADASLRPRAKLMLQAAYKVLFECHSTLLQASRLLLMQYLSLARHFLGSANCLQDMETTDRQDQLSAAAYDAFKYLMTRF